MRTIGQLTVTTPNDFEIAMTRSFDAPARLLYDAHTRPELIRRWLTGPDGWQMPVCDVDLRVGGRYRYEWAQEGRKGFGVSGMFRELVPGERIVHTETMDGFPAESIVTTTLTEKGGKTTLVMTIRLPTKEARDIVLKTGMETGVATSYDRLADILAAKTH